MSETYFWIETTDGGVSIGRMTKQQVERGIAELVKDGTPPKFLKQPPSFDGFSPNDLGVLLIKGEIVVPQPKTVVTKFEV